MKVVHIVPGFGNTFYCGNCLRDSSLIRTMRSAGHDATILPVYLPLTAHEVSQPEAPPVFYGAVSIYLRQTFPSLRSMPRWMHALLNSAPVLRLAVRASGSTRATGLEGLTESMLLGEKGYQRSDLKELTRYLTTTAKPDIVHLSNALLLGMAGMIRKEAKIPVVCSLQDEDVWIDAMKPPESQKLWDLMSERARDCDAMIAVSDWFAGKMSARMNLSSEKINTIPIGIEVEQYRFSSPEMNHPVIGYLSRMSHENGFGLFIDAFILLRKNQEFRKVKIRITGGKTGDDSAFFKEQLRKLKKAGLEDAVETGSGFTMPELAGFFDGLTLLSVPVLKGEAFGLYQIESMISGIPVVQPALGAFPEIIRQTGGGLTYEPNTPEALASAWSQLLRNPGQLKLLSRQGRDGVMKHFGHKAVTAQLMNIYRQTIASFH